MVLLNECPQADHVVRIYGCDLSSIRMGVSRAVAPRGPSAPATRCADAHCLLGTARKIEVTAT